MHLLSVLFVIFLVLKLTENIDWSWWLVCSPLIISFTVLFIVYGYVVYKKITN